VLSFNMGWRILVFYPEPACANEIIPNLFTKRKKDVLLELLVERERERERERAIARERERYFFQHTFD
jgi:hypothetical protein